MSDPSLPLRWLVNGLDLGPIPVTDRGLSYGDGLFETLRVRDGRVCQWGRHWGRLVLGCGRLGIPSPPETLVLDEVRTILHGVGDAVLRIQLTRGDGGRGYAPHPEPSPRRILGLYPSPAHPPEWREAGVVVRTCGTPASRNPALAGIKHLNRLDCVLARTEWSDPGIAEGLMAGPDGEIVGGTMTNLFLWDGSRLWTPWVDRCGIAGTVRALTMDLALNHGITCGEADLSRADLLDGAGIFLTNSVLGVWSVRRLDQRDYGLEDLPLALLHAVRLAAWTPDPGGP